MDLYCKSMDWFLYDRVLRHERVKNKRYVTLNTFYVTLKILLMSAVICKQLLCMKTRLYNLFQATNVIIKSNLESPYKVLQIP